MLLVLVLYSYKNRKCNWKTVHTKCPSKCGISISKPIIASTKFIVTFVYRSSPLLSNLACLKHRNGWHTGNFKMFVSGKLCKNVCVGYLQVYEFLSCHLIVFTDSLNSAKLINSRMHHHANKNENKTLENKTQFTVDNPPTFFFMFC